MIREEDLQEAIAECLGERNPNASTCIKLAAFYTIRENLFPSDQKEEPLPMRYSFSGVPADSGKVIEYDSETEFGQMVDGMEQDKLMPILDELMETISVLNPRLYNSVLNKIRDI